MKEIIVDNLEDITEEDVHNNGSDDNIDADDGDNSNVLISQRKCTAENIIPKLIDNKRSHLERKLSAAQRDALLLKEAKEDKLFRKELGDSLRETNKAFLEACQSMMEASKKISASMEKMESAYTNPVTPNMQQYVNPRVPTNYMPQFNFL